MEKLSQEPPPKSRSIINPSGEERGDPLYPRDQLRFLVRRKHMQACNEAASVWIWSNRGRAGAAFVVRMTSSCVAAMVDGYSQKRRMIFQLVSFEFCGMKDVEVADKTVFAAVYLLSLRHWSSIFRLFGLDFDHELMSVAR